MTSKRRRNRNSRNEERRFTVRGIRRDPPDIGKLSKALIGLAMAEAERAAQAEQAARDTQATVASSRKEQPDGEGDA
jgi:hypothetical protein